MFGECHAHIFLNGYDYRKAVETQKNGPQDALIRSHLKEYQKRGIRFVRDGGDHYGVSKRAARLAPEYEIDYRTPVFAIYKEGHYGKIVGKSFSDMKEYHRRVLEAAAEGADFIKIMTTGLLDFADHGKITGTPLSATDVKEMVHIAHEEGMNVMSHTNGDYGVQAAVEAGVDSLEHGNYMNEESLAMLAENDTLYAPCDGEVTVLMDESRHACGLTLENGMEILLHIGIDTVEMQGDGFEYLVSLNQKVKQGTPLVRFDREKIRTAGHPDVTVCIVTEEGNAKDFEFVTDIHAEAGKTEIVLFN